MKAKLILLLLFLYVSCVDRLYYDIGKDVGAEMTIEGFISNAPGPYTVSVSSTYDIEKKESVKDPISVKRVVISDNTGTTENLSETAPGKYQTNPTGIRGVVGRVYKIRVESWDGRIYESVPDTLLAPGKLDSIYYEFGPGATYFQSTFNVKVDSENGAATGKNFLWAFAGTYQAETHPEFLDVPLGKNKCHPIEEEQLKCNFWYPCSGLHNVAERWEPPAAERVGPCTCCTCWYSIYSYSPVLSDGLYKIRQDYKNLLIHRIPINSWVFMHKIHVEVSQRSLTTNTYYFWKAVKDQREAVGSLFQPVTGKIPSYFNQLEGPGKRVEGIFYATGVDTKSLYITPDDVPNVELLPPVPLVIVSCLDYFPNATNVKPAFWKD